MKAILTNFFFSFFRSLKAEKAGVAIAALALTYFLVQITISVIQKN